MNIAKINKVIMNKIDRGEMVTAEALINKLITPNEELKDYWKEKYREISNVSIGGKIK